MAHADEGSREGRDHRSAWSTVGLGLVLLGAGCGGGGEVVAKPMLLVELHFVDRALTPSYPIGETALPRNALVSLRFSERVDPSSVNDQSVAIRTGATFQSLPAGSFQVDGDRVTFDPTLRADASPNPFGFAPVTQYTLDLPGGPGRVGTLRNLDGDPLLRSFSTAFSTSDGYLRELVPPTLLGADFVPAPDPQTGQVPGDALMRLEFSEPMDPATLELATGASFTANDGVDVRYLDVSPDPNPNFLAGVEGQPVGGTLTPDAGARVVWFRPFFSFGGPGRKLTFSVQVGTRLKDLAGNRLANPRSFGPFTSDGTGATFGVALGESFGGFADRDPTTTDADWNGSVQGELRGAAISSRRVWVAGYQLANALQAGSYFSAVDPLMGAAYGAAVPGVTPATSLGRRVLTTFDDTDLGARGALTAIAWGPDSNATFAATYPELILRVGYQRDSSLSLTDTFSANYESTPLVLYHGPYTVAQHADVGNEYPIPNNVSGFPAPCTQPLPPPGTLQCLYDFRGYVDWPAPKSYFDWDPGDPAVAGDSVLLFDVSCKEGDTWQQMRAWLAVQSPAVPVALAGFPLRRLRSTFESDVADPPTGPVVGNPEASITDTAFTITRLLSVAQSRFYTPPSSGAGGPYPGPYSGAQTLGTKSDYQPLALTPAVQAGGATILVEYQGATALDPASARLEPAATATVTPWTTNVNVCDGYPYIRWRLTLRGNLVSNQVPRLAGVVLPVGRLP